MIKSKGKNNGNFIESEQNFPPGFCGTALIPSPCGLSQPLCYAFILKQMKSKLCPFYQIAISVANFKD